MLSKVIVITSGKGGVGKTTTVAHIGTALALMGRKVAVVDADIGLRNLDIILGLENRIVYDLVNVIEGTCKLNQALIRDKRVGNLYLLPAAQTRTKEAVEPEQMKALCHSLRETFDYVLIDSPAGIEGGFRNALAGADSAIIVTTPHVSAVRDADRIIGLVEAAEKGIPKLIINRLDIEMVKKGEMLDQDDIVDILSIGLLGIIPEDPAIVTASNRGESVFNNDKSKSAEAYRRIARRIEGEDVPLLDLDDNHSFLGRLKRILTTNIG
ncbi:MAG: septum site-determining protein MinD [Gemmatimonadetes bacterium]|nr:MAG: septum site-determining protein MinD [Gemmatimonadota bacterium]